VNSPTHFLEHSYWFEADSPFVPSLSLLKLRSFVFSPNEAVISQLRATPWVGNFPEEFSPEGATLLIGME
jgi:hypothetical protein